MRGFRFILLNSLAREVMSGQVGQCGTKMLVRGFAIPVDRGFVALFKAASSVGKHETEIVLCGREATRGGTHIPFQGFGVIVRYPTPFGVKNSQIILGAGITVMGRLLVPVHGGPAILSYAISVFIGEPEVVLGIRHSGARFGLQRAHARILTERQRTLLGKTFLGSNKTETQNYKSSVPEHSDRPY